ncbi:B12-binding domain-containing radical SAM protein [Ekhidna sp.]
MKVLLTHGYFLEEDPKEKEIMKPYPPLGILYISSYLNENEVENEVFDSTFSTKESLFKHIRSYNPDVIALYTNLMTKLNILDIIKEVKMLKSDCKIVLGGPDVTYNTKNYLDNGADFIVIGEGEVTMLELAQALSNGSSVDDVDGIAYLSSSGDEVKTKPRTKLRDINELPVPNRAAIPIEKYLKAWKDHHGKSALNVSTQRGCPYTCKWCSTAVYGQSYRRRSPKEVVKELMDIKENYNPDSIWFVDDVFTVSHKWLFEMADEMEKQDLYIPFECITRAERMNDEVIAALKRMGCFRVWIGAESGSQKIIDAMDRRVSVDKVREMIVKTRESGIEAGTFIMVGYPGETDEDIKETLHHLKISNPDFYTITVAYPIKGTDLYNEIEKEITQKPEWNLSTDRDIDFKRTYPKSFYKHAIRFISAEMEFYRYKLDRRLYGPKSFKLLGKIVFSRIFMWFYKKSILQNN